MFPDFWLYTAIYFAILTTIWGVGTLIVLSRLYGLLSTLRMDFLESLYTSENTSGSELAASEYIQDEPLPLGVLRYDAAETAYAEDLRENLRRKARRNPYEEVT